MTRTRASALTGLVFALLGLGRPSLGHGAVSEKACLTPRTGSLSTLLSTLPVAKKGSAAKMVPVTRGSPRWMAAFNAVLAWENDDCAAFTAFIE